MNGEKVRLQAIVHKIIVVGALIHPGLTCNLNLGERR